MELSASINRVIDRYPEAPSFGIMNLERGLKQAAARWRPEDGDPAAFESFAADHYVSDKDQRDRTFERLKTILVEIDGHMHDLTRMLRAPLDLDTGPILAVDEILGGYNPKAHFTDDLFANKIAFIVLLNFPLASMKEKETLGLEWSRRQWEEVRLAEQFYARIPASIQQNIESELTKAQHLIAGYNIWMNNILDPDSASLFPPGTRLIAHWNLRDEIRAQYAEKDGIGRQKLLQSVLEAIVRGEIPAEVIDNPRVEWQPSTGMWRASTRSQPGEARGRGFAAPVLHDDPRYHRFLALFHALRAEDPYFPEAPTHVERTFELYMGLPEERVHRLLEDILTAPAAGETAEWIQNRLGRDLQPFDIWFSDFESGQKPPETELNARVREKYSSAEAFESALPEILEFLGFRPERAAWLSERIAIEPARGAGHAMGPAHRGDKARLRTRIEPEGMDYKGFNTAMHELGHNCEQVFSVCAIDSLLLRGVPNTAFTEAMAFVFQSRDLDVLGYNDARAEREATYSISEYWAAYEIAGVAMVDMHVWRWLYAHPDADVDALKRAIPDISMEVWNRYYAPIFGHKDIVLPGCYSHMIQGMLYLPNYPIGHVIGYQIRERLLGAASFGDEFERMATLGSLAPDVWMMKALGTKVSAEPLIEGARSALRRLK